MDIFEVRRADDGEVAGARSDTEMAFGFAFGDRAEIKLPMRGVAPALRSLVLDPGRERTAVEMALRRGADQVEQGREDVDGLGEMVHDRAGRGSAARIADD